MADACQIMKKILLLILSPCFFSLCRPVQANKQPVIPEGPVSIAEGPSEQVLKFYTWYLHEFYLKKPVEAPEIVLSPDSSSYHLDPAEHLAFLKSSGYFSDKFYERELPACNACEAKLRSIDARSILRAGGSPIDPVDGRACAFLGWMPWTGGQGETLNTVNLVGADQIADSATVTIMLSDSAAEPYSYPRVTLLKEKNAWKICRIVISYDK